MRNLPFYSLLLPCVWGIKINIMSKITLTGISGKEFKDIRKGLLRDAKQLSSIVNGKTGHLGDVVSGIRTTMSSMDLKAKKLWQIFEQQKNQPQNPTH